MANPHHVHCLQFDFSLTSSSGESGELIASALQTWVQTTLLCVIDEVLEQVANELGLANKLSYRLGRLELDLGLIFADQSETEIARRLRAQLRTLLLEQLPSVSTATHMLDANKHADRYTQHHAILQGFLQTGRLNWEHSAHPTAAHRQVLRHALTENRQTVTALADEQLEFLRSVVRDERQRTRLLRQYETSELLLVARHFLATWPPQQAELALDWISLELTRLESDADVSRCEEFWRYVLHRLEANLDKHEQQALNLATPWLLNCASRDVSATQDTEAKTQARAIAIYHSFIEKNTRISNQAKAALQQVLTHLRQPLMHTLEIETTSDQSAISEIQLQTQLQTQLQNQLQAADITALSTQWQSLITDHAQALHHSYATLNAQQKAQLIAALSLQKQSDLAQIIRASAAELTAEIMQEAEQLAQIIQQEGVNLSANQLREKWCYAILTEGSEDGGAIVDSDNAAAAQKTAKLLRTTIAPHLAASDSIWQSLQIALIYQQPQLSHTRAALAAMNADTMAAPELEEAAHPNQIKSKNSVAEFENTYRDEEQRKPERKTDISQVLQQAKQTPASLPTNLRKLIQKKSSFADFTNQLSDAHRHQLMIALINSAASANTNKETSKAAHQLLQKIENEAYQSHNIRNYLNAALQQLIESQMIDFEILRARYPTTRVGGEDGEVLTQSGTGANHQDTSNDSVGFIRSTDIEAKSIQMNDAKLIAGSTENNSSNSPTNRHSRAEVDEDFGQHAAHSATDVRLQANVRPARGKSVSFDGHGVQSEIEQNSTPLDRNTNENETAPTQTLLNSLPFKGRARVGMGVNWKWAALKPELRPIPISSFPLKGKELKARAHERMTDTENEIVSDRVSGTSDESVQQLERVQNLKPRLRGNDTASFAGDEIDALSNASGQEKATSRAGATRQDISDNSAGFTRPTDVEATAIQMGDAKLRSGTTDKNSTNNPTSRHSRESGNPVSFDEQGVQSKIQQNSTPLDRNINENETASTETRLNSLPLKGKGLKARQQELMVVIGNDLISDRISGVSDESVQQLQRVQNLTPLDSRLRGNDVSSFVEGGIDILDNASHQDKPGISRAGATRQETSNNSAGFTRPTDVEVKSIQMGDAKLRSGTTEKDLTNNPTSHHSRESWYPVSSDEQGAPSKIQQNSTPLDHNTNENETAPTDALLNSLPFKGRARVGMGGNWKWTAYKLELTTIPIPSFPLKGKGLKARSHEWKAATENDLISDRISGTSDESVQQLERVQNPKPLDFPLRGNDASLFVDGGIDALSNASDQEQTTSMTGATRQDTSDNSAGFTRLTDVEARSIQVGDAKLVSNTTEKNSTNNPTSRHSREGGNPVSFDEHGVQSEIEQNSTPQGFYSQAKTRPAMENPVSFNEQRKQSEETRNSTPLDRNINENETVPTETLLNSHPSKGRARVGMGVDWKWTALKPELKPIPIPRFPLKGKGLNARAQERMVVTGNNLISDRASSAPDESVQPLERVQNLKPLDSRLRGNDTASFAGDEIDALSNASNQEQTTSRAGATRQDISDNSTGFTRPTDVEAKSIQMGDAKLRSGTADKNSINNPTSRHSREGGSPVSFDEQGAQSKIQQNSTPLDRNINENETASTETRLNSLPFKGRARVGMGVDWKWTACKPELKPIPSFLLKGTELKARAREWRTASENDLISDRASRAPDESVQQLERVQNPQPLDSSLQGAPSLASEHRLPSGQHAAQISRQSLRWNDVSSFVDGGIDALTNASNEDQTPSRAGATRQETSNNSAGFTRPTDVEAKSIQVGEANLRPGKTENNSTNNPTSRHSRAGVDEDFGQHAAHSATDVRLQANVRPARGNPVSFDEHGTQSEIKQNSAPQDFYSQVKTQPALENPVSFNEQREKSEETQNSTPLDRNINENETAPTEALLNSLPFKGRARVGMGVDWKWTALKPELKPILIPAFPLKGKGLNARAQERMTATENEIVNDRASSTPDESARQLERVQNPKQLDFPLQGAPSLASEHRLSSELNATKTPHQPLRGNDALSFVDGGIDTLDNASHQEQTPSRAGATRQETSNNSAGFTRPTDVEAKSIQVGDANLRPGKTDKNSINNPTNRHSREGVDEDFGQHAAHSATDVRLQVNVRPARGNPVSLDEHGTQSEIKQNSAPQDFYSQVKTQPALENPVSFNEQREQSEETQNSTPLDRNINENETAPTETLLNSHPSKGRARVGMGVDWKWTALKPELKPIPIPTFPVKGKGLKARAHERMTATENEIVSDSASSTSDESVQPLERVQNLKPRLRGNDTASFAGDEIDALSNASGQEKTPSRAGITRQDKSDNSAGFTRPTDVEAKSIQVGDAKLRSGTADKNSTNNPISRHSRESGNPVSLNSQREQSEETQNSTPLDRNKNETAPTEALLNSLPFKGRARVGMGVNWKWTAHKPELKPIPIPTFPLKGKGLKARAHERMTATENEIVSDRASSTSDESVQQLERGQNPQPLDFPLQGAPSLTSEHRIPSEQHATKNPHQALRGNDTSSLVDGGIDTLANASNQEQTTSKAGATRQDTSNNSAGFTRPTNFKDQSAPASAIAHPVSFAPPGQIQSHTEQAQQISALQETQTSTQHEHLKSRLPQRLARALLQADLHVLDDVWEKLIHEYADLMAQSLRIYLKRPELRQNLIDAHTPEKMLELLQVMSPNLSLLLRECWDNWPIFSGFVDAQNKSALQRRSLILVWQAVFDLDLARQTSLAQVRQLIALLLTQKKPTTKKLTTSTTRSVDAPTSSNSAIRQVHYLMQIEALHHRVSASAAPLWHSALTHMLRMDNRIAQLAVLEQSEERDEDTALISHEEVRQTLLMELSHQDRKELSIAVSSLEREMQAELGEPFSSSSTKKSLAAFLQQEQAYPRAAEKMDGRHKLQTKAQADAQAQAQNRLEQLTLLAQTTRRLSAAEEIRLGDLFTHLLANAISNHSLHARLQQELHAMLEHDAVIDRICLCLSDVTLERVFVLLQADLLEPARRLASIIKSALAIDLYQQADFFHVQAWRLIYRAAYGVSSNMMQTEIDLPSTVAADSVHARHFQCALLNEIVAHYGLGSVSSCCEKLRQASVATVAKQNLEQARLHDIRGIRDIHGSSTPQAQTTTPLAQTNRPTTKPRSAFAEAEQGEVDAYVLNAGLVIVAPYVQRLFGLFELTRDGAFVDEAAAQRAVHLLQYIVTGESATPEYQLSLNKLLCGIHGGVPIIAGIEITEHEKEVIAQMLQGVIAHWNALGNTTIAGLRETFLARQGQLRHEEDAWHLKIPQSTFDMLLDRLPWSFAMIKFPWMPEPLHVSWRT